MFQIRSPDDTMSDMVRIARTLREQENFRGYIHLKTIPDAAPALVEEAGRYADRLSINIELPTSEGMGLLAPEKDPARIKRSMADVTLLREASREVTHTGRKATRFAPAGQSTQMIIGADEATDATILTTSAALYGSYRLSRVYYSAFSPIPDASAKLPLIAPPLVREHRLYQADWLLRFYGFAANELAGKNGMLDLEVDPKLSWALQHREAFPVDVNAAPRDALLRVPGFGTKTVARLLAARRYRTVRYEDLLAMGASMGKARAFVQMPGWTPRGMLEDDRLRERFAPPPEQLALF
jgi:putative DNA modification/repair radical SAM protein